MTGMAPTTKTTKTRLWYACCWQYGRGRIRYRDQRERPWDNCRTVFAFASRADRDAYIESGDGQTWDPTAAGYVEALSRAELTRAEVREPERYYIDERHRAELYE